MPCTLGMCLDPEANQWPFSAQGDAEPHQPGLYHNILNIIKKPSHGRETSCVAGCYPKMTAI